MFKQFMVLYFVFKYTIITLICIFMISPLVISVVLGILLNPTYMWISVAFLISLPIGAIILIRARFLL